MWWIRIGGIGLNSQFLIYRDQYTNVDINTCAYIYIYVFTYTCPSMHNTQVHTCIDEICLLKELGSSGIPIAMSKTSPQTLVSKYHFESRRSSLRKDKARH